MTDLFQTELQNSLKTDGFAFTGTQEAKEALSATALADWPEFAESWNDLGDDLYMADGGRYRRRRHAALFMENGMVTRLADQPHYQSRDYNTLNGGIERWFAPVHEKIFNNRALQAFLYLCNQVFSELSSDVPRWKVEIHQFRIEAKAGQIGQPTPEGLHRDGVDWVMVLLVARMNVQSGVTSIHNDDRDRMGSFTLTEPLDAAWVDDKRMYHGVTPIEPIDPSEAAYRDVLVLTFKAEA